MTVSPTAILAVAGTELAPAPAKHVQRHLRRTVLKRRKPGEHRVLPGRQWTAATTTGAADDAAHPPDRPVPRALGPSDEPASRVSGVHSIGHGVAVAFGSGQASAAARRPAVIAKTPGA